MVIPTTLNQLGEIDYIQRGLIFNFDSSKEKIGDIESIYDSVSKERLPLYANGTVEARRGLCFKNQISSLNSGIIFNFPKNYKFSTNNYVEMVIGAHQVRGMRHILIRPYINTPSDTQYLISVGNLYVFNTNNHSTIRYKENNSLDKISALSFSSDLNVKINNQDVITIEEAHNFDKVNYLSVSTYANREFNLRLCSLRIYDRNLTDKEILHNFNIDSCKFDIGYEEI